ncbi:MAG: 3-oxoacyl-[acyl-carrier-protein] synthase [Abditibacteriota bacterium]|nr:3-oxoacyl-[acyl-carrier-protein] synthase [Abditibacteriota bacterium]
MAVTGSFAMWGSGTARREIGGAHQDATHHTLQALFAAAPIDPEPVDEASIAAVPAEPSIEERLVQQLPSELAALHLWDEGTNRIGIDAERIGVAFSTSKVLWSPGGVIQADAWDERLSPLARLARSVGARGPMSAPVAACATGAHCLLTAAQWIEDGYADVVIAGALERPVEPLALAGYAAMGALSPSGVMRPFDRKRDGFVANTGGAWLVLENEKRARARGVSIQAYLTGWSMQADVLSATAMEASGATIARAIEQSLRRADCPQIGYVNAHGTATKLNDAIEARAIQSTLGLRVPVSATKPLTGHLLGAAGAVEAALCVKVLGESYLPPTPNLRQVDEECGLNVLQSGQSCAIHAAMSLSYGFGGHIGVLIFENSR